MAVLYKNRFLEILRERTGTDLATQCESVPMPLHTPLFHEEGRPRYVHFLTSGVASIVTTMQSGSAVEVGMFSSEGFPETQHLLGPQRGVTRCMMQVGGSALRMDFKKFRETFLSNEVVRELALRLIQFEVLAGCQLTACNGLHEVEDRLARWLLMVQDLIGTAELPLTQTYVSNMLGTRRATVTIAAGNLQRAGIINYERGLIRVEKRDRLEEVACECYPILHRLRANVYR